MYIKSYWFRLNIMLNEEIGMKHKKKYYKIKFHLKLWQ